MPGRPPAYLLGQSVTNAAEEIAAAVVLANALPTNRPVWIEQYEDGARGTSGDPATFDLLGRNV